MAAIANVKVIESMIEIPAAQYRRVDREAKVGDLIRFDDESSFVTRGGYYEVVRVDNAGDPQIIDNDGDEYDLCGDDYEVYEKVTGGVAKESEDLFTYEGTQYRKVKRKAAVGERVLIIGNDNEHRFDIGEVITVTRRYDEGGLRVGVRTEAYASMVRDYDYVVLEPVSAAAPETIVQDGVTYRRAKDGEKPTHFIRKPDAHVRKTVIPGKVYEIISLDDDGDYECINEQGNRSVSVVKNSIGLVACQPKSARIPVGSYVKITNGVDLPNGSIAKVVADDHDGCPYKCELLDSSDYDYLTEDDFEVLSEAEAKAAVDADAERAKWAAIGRKVNEYKAGDIVEITYQTGRLPVGTIGIIGEVDCDRSFRVNTFDVRSGNWYGCGGVRLITPVEQRFDQVAVS